MPIPRSTSGAGRSEREEESERAIGKRKGSERFEGSEAGEAVDGSPIASRSDAGAGERTGRVRGRLTDESD